MPYCFCIPTDSKIKIFAAYHSLCFKYWKGFVVTERVDKLGKTAFSS